MKKLLQKALSLLLAALAAVLPVYAADIPQDDPWMEYALFHMGNVLPFMRQEELSFLEPGCQVYLGARLSAYTADLKPLLYAIYPVFVDGQAIAIATVSEYEDGELSFMAGPMFAEQLNEAIAGNPNIALLEGEGFTQVINDQGAVYTLHAFVDVDIPPAPPLSSIQFGQVVPVAAVQEAAPPQSKAEDGDGGIGVPRLFWGAAQLAGLLLWV